MKDKIEEGTLVVGLLMSPCKYFFFYKKVKMPSVSDLMDKVSLLKMFWLLGIFILTNSLFAGCIFTSTRQFDTQSSKNATHITEEDITKKIHEHPNNPSFYLERGDARSRWGNGEGSIADYTKVIELIASRKESFNINPAGVYSSRGQEYHVLADLFKDEGRLLDAKRYYSLSLKDFQEVLKVCPSAKYEVECELTSKDIKKIYQEISSISN